MRQRIVITLPEHDAPRKVRLQLREELLVLRLATAEDHQRELPPLQHLGQRAKHQLETLLLSEPAHNSPERHLRSDVEPHAPDELPLELGLDLQMIRIVVHGQMPVPPRIPLVVINTIENAAQCTTTCPETVLQPHAVLVGANLAGMRRTHGRDRVRVHDPVTERIDPIGTQIILVQQVIPRRPEIDIIDRRSGEYSLVTDVVDGQHGPRVLEERVALVDRLQEHRGKGGMPIITVQDPWRPLQALTHDERGSRERQKPQVLVDVGRIKSRAVIEHRAVQQINRRRRAREVRRQCRKHVAMRTYVHIEVLQCLQRLRADLRPIDGLIKRSEQPHVMADSVEILRQRRGHIRETASLR